MPLPADTCEVIIFPTCIITVLPLLELHINGTIQSMLLSIAMHVIACSCSYNTCCCIVVACSFFNYC